jgi:copper oxidase (laccase) domain-containing protein
VGVDVVRQVQAVFDQDAAVLLPRFNGSTHFDLWAANRLVLEQAGVGEVAVAGICTASNLGDWYSHRAEGGKTGRFGVLIALT